MSWMSLVSWAFAVVWPLGYVWVARRHWHHKGMRDGMDAVMGAVMSVGGAPLAWQVSVHGIKLATGGVIHPLPGKAAN